jgi:hypothetical protein
VFTARSRSMYRGTRPASRAVPTDILHFPARVVVTPADALHRLRGVERRGTTSWRKYGWRRPRLRVHPAKPKIGLRKIRADDMWHIDSTVIRLLDGPRLSPCRDRQLLATDPGVASRRDVRPGQHRSRVARRQPRREVRRHRPTGVGRCAHRKRECAGRRTPLHGRAAPGAGLDGAEVLELHDRSVVALPETSMSSFTRSRASPRCVDSWRSTSTNTTACFRIRRSGDRRRTRCTSAPETQCRQP